jgi:hypothetical protein
MLGVHQVARNKFLYLHKHKKLHQYLKPCKQTTRHAKVTNVIVLKRGNNKLKNNENKNHVSLMTYVSLVTTLLQTNSIS